MSFDLYAEVTNRIVAMLEKGVVPWRSPILGQSKAGYPRNLESGNPTLECAGHTGPCLGLP